MKMKLNRRTLLACVPAVPIAAAIPQAAAVQAALVEPGRPPIEIGDFVNGREVLDICEACSKPLFEGDMAFSYDDGPTFCEEHAPTWSDLKSMQDEAIAGGYWLENFDTPEEAQEAIDSVLHHIAAGHGDVKYVWGL